VRIRLHSRCFAAVLILVMGSAATEVAYGEAANPEAAGTVDGPLVPGKTLQHFRLPEELKIELVAAEPLVVDPVEIRFDERGRMWVVEMRDYPHGPQPGAKPQSRIRILTDTDGDGSYDRGDTFADHLLFATGVQPWGDGAFVTLSGQVVLMRDIDGDGRADHQETWYRGFAEQNSQLRANHPRLAADGFIYIANGLRGGTVEDVRGGGKPIPLRGVDFRFDPRGTSSEAVTGMGQFGLTFDDAGNRFVCSNRNPLKHIVIEERYLKANPQVAVAAVTRDVARSGADSRIYPISRAWTTSNLHAGQFTAACGVKIYRGDALPANYYGHALTCDPTGNLVHREIMQRDGATFTSQPARDGVEFLASPDTWFRPVNLEIGPDGALYVVDMYRAVIEHPQFMPEELKQRPDLLLGKDRGRIYRISARRTSTHKAEASLPLTQLPSASSKRLVALLEHPSSWWRDAAVRLLIEREDGTFRPQLMKLAEGSPQTAARLSALQLAAGREWLTPQAIEQALQDKQPAVRRLALQLGEPLLDSSATLRDAYYRRVGDDSPQVRFQLALSLSQVGDERNAAALETIATAAADDAWTQDAVAIAARGQAAALFRRLLAREDIPSLPEGTAIRDLLTKLLKQAATAGAANADRYRALLRDALALPSGGSAGVLRFELLTTLAQAVRRGGGRLDAVAKESPDTKLADLLQKMVDHAQRLVRGEKAPIGNRRAALAFLEQTQPASPTLVQLAMHEPNQSLRAAAITALRTRQDQQLWQSLLGAFSQLSPSLRRTVIDASLGNPLATGLLLDLIEAGKIRPGELDRAAVSRLTKHRDPMLRSRAARLLADAVPADRRRVLADYQVALTLEGDAAHGKQVFKKNCAQCHRIGQVGVNVAPDISDSRTKQPAQLLTDILQPNRAIDAAFISYAVATEEGRVLTGIIAAETTTSITLKQAEGKTVTLSRGEIDRIRSSGVSLMPEGVEKNIPPQAMADLIAFIKNWRYLDGRIPLGRRGR